MTSMSTASSIHGGKSKVSAVSMTAEQLTTLGTESTQLHLDHGSGNRQYTANPGQEFLQLEQEEQREQRMEQEQQESGEEEKASCSRIDVFLWTLLIAVVIMIICFMLWASGIVWLKPGAKPPAAPIVCSPCLCAIDTGIAGLEPQSHSPILPLEESYVIARGKGGNGRVGTYIYGDGPLPGLRVLKQGPNCSFVNEKFILYDCENSFPKSPPNVATMGCDEWPEQPFSYACDASNGYLVSDREVNGYQSMSDLWYFSNKVVEFYDDVLSNALAHHPPIGLYAHFAYGEQAQYNADWNDKMPSYSMFMSDSQKQNGDESDLLYPMAVADIIAHELTHMYTENKVFGGPWGESFCDIAGEVFEFWHNGRADWIHGAMICRDLEVKCTAKQGGARRSFMEPKYATLTADSMSAKEKAEVINTAFYSIMQKTGIGPIDLFKVWDDAQTIWSTNEEAKQPCVENATNPCSAVNNHAFFATGVLQASQGRGYPEDIVARMKAVFQDIKAL